MTVCAYTMAQEEQSIINFVKNTTIQIDSNKFSLLDLFDKNQEILFEAERLKEDLDSIEKELALRTQQLKDAQEIINAKDKFLLRKDTAFYTQRDRFNLLKQDYNKLTKVNRLNGILGGEVGFMYNTETKTINNPYIALNLGLMFKRKYIISTKVGFNLNKEIVIGLNGSMVF